MALGVLLLLAGFGLAGVFVTMLVASIGWYLGKSLFFNRSEG